MADFKSRQEIWEYLASGGKVRLGTWPPEIYLLFHEGRVVFSRDLRPRNAEFSTISAWYKHVAKKKVQVKCWVAVRRSSEGRWYVLDAAGSSREMSYRTPLSETDELVETTLEFEVEDDQ